MTLLETPTTKVTLNGNNFGKDNTPDWARVAGDWMLRIGVMGGGLIGINAVVPNEALAVIPPKVLTTIVSAGWIMVLVGIFGKSFMKMFGEKPKEDFV